MSIVKTNDKLLWALTPDADNAVRVMVEAGLDRDLALSVLEQLWAEHQIYSLDDDEVCRA